MRGDWATPRHTKALGTGRSPSQASFSPPPGTRPEGGGVCRRACPGAAGLFPTPPPPAVQRPGPTGRLLQGLTQPNPEAALGGPPGRALREEQQRKTPTERLRDALPGRSAPGRPLAGRAPPWVGHPAPPQVLTSQLCVVTKRLKKLPPRRAALSAGERPRGALQPRLRVRTTQRRTFPA